MNAVTPQTETPNAMHSESAQNLKHRWHRIAVLNLVLVVTTLGTRAPCLAQLDGQVAAKPLGTAFTRGLTQITMMDYVKELSEKLEIGETAIKMMSSVKMEDMAPKVTEPVNGAAYYMVQGLIPSFETVTFQEVADETDVKRILEAQKRIMGGNNATVDDKGNGCYLFVRSNSWDAPVPPNKDPKEHVSKLKEGFAARQNRTIKNTAELIEKDGKPFVKQSWSMTQCFRYHDQLLFAANFEELWEMELPSRDSLIQGASGDNDMGIEAFFDRIPVAMKTLGWNILNSTAGVQMQQRDGEASAIADLRKSAIQFALNLTRAVMFDVDEADGWLQWADEDDQAIRAAINFNARRNAGITNLLDEVSSGNSRFGSILRDESVATFHTCLKVFEERDPMVQAAAAWLLHQIEAEAAGNQQLITAANDVAESLTSISESRTLEVFVKAGWTEETDGVIYAGLQVDDNPNLLRAIYTFVAAGGDNEINPELREVNGRAVLSLVLPDEHTNELAKKSGLRISHIYLAHQNSCLWLAVGGENCHEILWRSIERCETSGLAVRTPLVTADVDVEQWLALPQDDPVGVSGLLLWLDANVAQFPVGMTGIPVFGGTNSEPPTPLLKKSLDLGGDPRAGFTLLADKSGLRASASLGEALGNYWIARLLDMQDRQMKSRTQNQLRTKKMQEGASTPKQKAAGNQSN